MPKSNKKLRENKLSSAEPKRKINYQCGKCDKRYITKISLKQHIAMKHLETMYSCGVCDQTYRKVLEIKEHMTSVHPEKRDMVTTYCGECQTDFPNDLNYKHLMRVHRALYTRKVYEDGKARKLPSNGIKTTFDFLDLNVSGVCYFCNSSLSKAETDSHILTTHFKVTYTCSKCGEEKATRNKMYSHIKEAHLTKSVSFPVTLEECLLQSCGLCDYKAKYQEFANHIKEHETEMLAAEYSYKSCSFCDFKHISQRRLESHIAKKHEHNSPFICDVCDFPSRNKKCLADHYKTHHPEYKFCKCKLCGFESSHYPALWRHHREIHEQFTHLKCKICCAIFKRNENLQLHIENMHKIVEESEKENYCDEDHGTGYDELQEQAGAGEGGEKAEGPRSVGLGADEY